MEMNYFLNIHIKCQIPTRYVGDFALKGVDVGHVDVEMRLQRCAANACVKGMVGKATRAVN